MLSGCVFQGAFVPADGPFPSARIKSLLKQGEKNIKIEAHEVEICFDFKQGQTQRTPQPPEKH